MWGVIVSKQLVFVTGFLILSGIAITIPQIAQAHTSGQSLSSSEVSRELKDLFNQGQQLVDEGKFSEALSRLSTRYEFGSRKSTNFLSDRLSPSRSK
jgi:hypothetical protein